MDYTYGDYNYEEEHLRQIRLYPNKYNDKEKERLKFGFICEIYRVIELKLGYNDTDKRLKFNKVNYGLVSIDNDMNVYLDYLQCSTPLKDLNLKMVFLIWKNLKESDYTIE